MSSIPRPAASRTPLSGTALPVRLTAGSRPPAAPAEVAGRDRDVIVIGAGPGGLASAMLLAKQGRRVTVLERGDRVGGRSQRLTQHTDAGDFHFDTGPTFFLYPDILRGIYADCGFDFDREVPMVRLDPLYDLIFGDAAGDSADKGSAPSATLTVHADPEQLKTEVARFNAHDAANVQKFMADNVKKFAAFRPILQRPFSGYRDLLKPDMLRALPQLTPWRSVDSDLGRYFDDPRVRLAFSFQSKYLGMSPFQCPSLFTILSYMEHGYGIWHPLGGCHAVIEDMAAKARLLGVDIVLNAEVTGLAFEGRTVTGASFRDGSGAVHALKASSVVMNADFGHAVQRLVPEALRPSWPDRKVNRAKYSCSTFMLYLGIKGHYPQLAHHTIYLSGDYQGNLAAIGNGAVPEDPSLYIQNPAAVDSSVAPEGYSTLYVLAPVAHEMDAKGGAASVDWAAAKDAFRERVYAQLAGIGLGDVRERVVCEVVRTPRDWRDDFAVHRGATFNLAHSMDQMLMFRPKNRFGDVKGLYLVGGGTHPGSGLPVIFESARMTSQLVAEDFPAAQTDGMQAEDSSPCPLTRYFNDSFKDSFGKDSFSKGEAA